MEDLKELQLTGTGVALSRCRRSWWSAAALSVAYLLAAEVGHSLASGPGFADVWPPSGLLLAALLLTSTRDWGILLLATLPANLVFDVVLHGRPGPLSAGFWIANAVEAFLGACLFRRFVGRTCSMGRFRDVVMLTVLTAAVSTVVGATLGMTALRVVTGGSPGLSTWFAWWGGDVLGILVVAPVFFAFAEKEERTLRERGWSATLETAIVLLAIVVAARLVLGSSQWIGLPLLLFALPFTLWAVLRLGHRGLALSQLTLCAVVLYLARRGASPLLVAAAVGFSLQLFLAAYVVPFSILGAVLAERERAELAQQRTALELRSASQAVFCAAEPIGYVDLTRAKLNLNPAFTKHFGYTEEDFTIAPEVAASPLWVDPADRAAMIDSTYRDGEWRDEVELRTKDGQIVPTRVTASLIRGERGAPIGFVTVYSTIQEERRIERRRAAELEINRLLASASTIQEAAPGILMAVREILDWDVATLWLVEPDQKTLRAVSVLQKGDERPGRLTVLPPEISVAERTCLLGQVQATARPIWMEDVTPESCAPCSELLVEHGLKSLLALPLQSGAVVVGILELISKERRALEASVLDLMEPIGLRIGHFIIQKRHMAALEVATGAARAASRAKSDFVATISHEIRNPMNAVLGMLELLSRTNLDASQRRQLNLARSSGRALLDLLKRVLDFSKIEAGKLDLVELAVDVRRLAEDIVASLASKAQSKGIDLVLVVDGSVPDVLFGDPVRLRQILINLIDNAIKFTEDGSVRLSIFPRGKSDEKCELCFEVEDTGIGIPKERIPRLFEAFEQENPEIARRYGGTGLGLAITRGLIERMGGSMGVESEPGKGSTFSFSIRLGYPKEGAEPVHSSSRRGQTTARPLRIVLFEDNAINREVVRAMLEGDGHTVEMYEDAREAVSVVSRGELDVVLMDLQMPEVSGLEATAQIRESERERGARRIPIVALTARAFEGDREQCLQAGMDGYVSKPIDLEDLRTELALVTSADDRQGFRLTPTPRSGGPTVALAGDELLDRLNGNITLLTELARMFRKSGPALVAEIRSAFEARDAVGVERVAHKLRSASGNLSGHLVFALAKRVEELAIAGKLDEIGPVIPSLSMGVEQLASLLSAFAKQKARDAEPEE